MHEAFARSAVALFAWRLDRSTGRLSADTDGDRRASAQGSHWPYVRGYPTAQPALVAEPSARAIPVRFHSLSRSVLFSPRILDALLSVYGIVLLFYVARLAWFGYQTRRLRRLAYPRPLPCALARLVEHCAGRSHSRVLPCCAPRTYWGRRHWGSDAPCSCSQRHSFSTIFRRTISSRLYRMNWRTYCDATSYSICCTRSHLSQCVFILAQR